MVDAGILTVWARGGDGKMTTAVVATHFEKVGVENKRKKTSWAKRLPAALIANCKWSSAATIVKDKAFGVIF